MKLVTLQWIWIASAFMTVAAIVVRLWLFNSGILFGELDAGWADLGITALIIITAWRWIKWFVAKQGSSSHSGSAAPDFGVSISVLAAALSVVAIAYGVVKLVPTTPQAAAETACRGTPVQGGQFLGQTRSDGVNARAGAGTAFEQNNRFAGNCTLSFDGFCIGDPVPNEITDIADTRWLILHRHPDQLVSAANIRSQSPDALLGPSPAPECSRLGGLAPPGKVAGFTISKLTPEEAKKHGLGIPSVMLTATARSAALMGYGIRIHNPVSNPYEYEYIKVKDNGHDFQAFKETAPWTTRLFAGTGRIDFAATVCLAAAVPYGSPQVMTATFRHGVLVNAVPNSTVNAAEARRLAETACSGPD